MPLLSTAKSRAFRPKARCGADYRAHRRFGTCCLARPPISGLVMKRAFLLGSLILVATPMMSACAAAQGGDGPSLAKRPVEGRFDVAPPPVVVAPPGPLPADLAGRLARWESDAASAQQAFAAERNSAASQVAAAAGAPVASGPRRRGGDEISIAPEAGRSATRSPHPASTRDRPTDRAARICRAARRPVRRRCVPDRGGRYRRERR